MSAHRRNNVTVAHAEDRLLALAEYAAKRNGWPLSWPADENTWVQKNGVDPEVIAAAMKVVQAIRRENEGHPRRLSQDVLAALAAFDSTQMSQSEAQDVKEK